MFRIGSVCGVGHDLVAVKYEGLWFQIWPVHATCEEASLKFAKLIHDSDGGCHGCCCCVDRIYGLECGGGGGGGGWFAVG